MKSSSYKDIGLLAKISCKAYVLDDENNDFFTEIEARIMLGIQNCRGNLVV